MITFDSVTVTAGNNTIIHDVTLEVHAGQKTALFGKSGSGKSTILLTLMGARVPSSGIIRFKGFTVNSRTVGTLRREVSYIGQEPVLGSGTTRETLLLPFTFKAQSAPRPGREHISRVLDSLDLPLSILEKDVSVISGGEKQRVAIARELLQKKEVFILDEVTSALDRASKKAVLKLFSHNPFTVLSVSHDPDWLAMCDSFYHVKEGTVEPVEDFRRYLDELS